jgi:Flagellar biosynthesis pathway, component FliP
MLETLAAPRCGSPKSRKSPRVYETRSPSERTALAERLAAAAAAILFETAGAAVAQATVPGGAEDGSLALRAIQLFVLVTLLSLAPAIAVMATCFPFMVTVLSILRTAVGLQQSPPNMLIVSLALFLTWFVMAPVFEAAWAEGVVPLLEERVTLETAALRTLGPFRES